MIQRVQADVSPWALNMKFGWGSSMVLSMFMCAESKKTTWYFTLTWGQMQGKKTSQKTYLITDVDLNPRFEVVENLFEVPCPGGSQVAGITVRLGRGRERKREEVRRHVETDTCLPASTKEHRRTKAHTNGRMLLYQVELRHSFSDKKHLNRRKNKANIRTHSRSMFQ